MFIGNSDSARTRARYPGMTADYSVGNSFLLEMDDGEYVYIGESIKEFHTKDGEKIIAYVSPIGNSEVAYPAALDTGGNVYYPSLKVECDGVSLNPTPQHVIDKRPY